METALTNNGKKYMKMAKADAFSHIQSTAQHHAHISVTRN